MTRVPPSRLLPWALCTAAWLTACGTPPPAAAPEPAPIQAPRYATSFDCSLAETPVQHYVCRDPALAALDVQLGAAWRAAVRQPGGLARAELLAEQRAWQLALYPRCGVHTRPAETDALPAAQTACLNAAWRERLVALQRGLAPQPAADGQRDHPLAAYVGFREAQALVPGLCQPLGIALNEALVRTGAVDVTRLPGARLVASLTGPRTATLPDGRVVEVQGHDAGPYGSYEIRATGLQVNGQRVLDERTVPAWMLDLPNAGGSFSGTSSQTGDYAALDVFMLDGHAHVLVTQTWGYHASAARGESPHAALYELAPEGLQRRCLWRTYLTPPVAQVLRRLPQFQALQALLDEAAGPDSPRLPPDDRRDAGLFARELQWQLLHMPLVVLHEALRDAHDLLRRQRHDEALEALFTWSERNLPSKQLYRRLMPLIAPAHAELQKSFRDAEGLNADEARRAADLLVMTALARAAERWRAAGDPLAPSVGPGYRPRFAVAPAAGELEKGRAYTGLHSALLNRAPDGVVDDLWRALWGTTQRVGEAGTGLGPAGDTPLMAAVRSPERVTRLLAAGADVQARNAWGKTALMMAAQADQPEAVQKLLDGGADVAARTTAWQADGAGGPDNAEGARPGSTALWYAAAQASAPVIERLLQAGAVAPVVPSACEALAGNPRLDAAQRTALATRLCPPRP